MKTKHETLIKSETNTKLKAVSRALIVAGVIAGISLPVAAKKYRDYNNSAYDYATVVDAVPVIETYEVNQPVEQCWVEPVRRPVYHSDRRHKSRTPDLLGAIIGGAIGNRFGHGDGRKIATVAGAVLGSSVGRDIRYKKHYKRNDRYVDNGYASAERCELRDSFVTKERVIGYDVSYKYRGNVFYTKMDQRPERKIKVMITVNPV